MMFREMLHRIPAGYAVGVDANRVAPCGFCAVGVITSFEILTVIDQRSGGGTTIQTAFLDRSISPLGNVGQIR